MNVKIKHNKAHVLYKALGYDHWAREMLWEMAREMSWGTWEWALGNG